MSEQTIIIGISPRTQVCSFCYGTVEQNELTGGVGSFDNLRVLHITCIPKQCKESIPINPLDIEGFRFLNSEDKKSVMSVLYSTGVQNSEENDCEEDDCEENDCEENDCKETAEKPPRKKLATKACKKGTKYTKISQKPKKKTIPLEDLEKLKRESYLNIIINIIRLCGKHGKGLSRTAIYNYLGKIKGKLNLSHTRKVLNNAVGTGIIVQNKQHFKVMNKK